MLSAIRSRLTYANVAVTLALVFAMTGGAYAANHYLITSTKQISPKVLKSLKGASGAKGANGANGTNGTAGATGPGGPQGPGGPGGPGGRAGPKGEPGAPGAPGKNGENGTTGFTKTLPSKMTETGTWSFAGNGEGYNLPSISFNIPLATALSGAAVHYINSAGKEVMEQPEGSEEVELKSSTNCHGTADAPTADPGNLCVYEKEALGLHEHSVFGTQGSETSHFAPIRTAGVNNSNLGSGVSGAELFFGFNTTTDLGAGTWAVTAP